MAMSQVSSASTGPAPAGETLTRRIGKLWERHTAGETLLLPEVVDTLKEYYQQPHTTMTPLLGLLRLNGKPYNLDRYFPMEPLFKLPVPKQTILKCARQVSKSTSLSSRGVLHSATFPYLRMLFVTPRYEQVRKLSTNYVRPFIHDSLFKPLLIDESCSQAVLQRSFSNQSAMYFSFAFIDVDRIRGIACDMINFDEI